MLCRLPSPPLRFAVPRLLPRLLFLSLFQLSEGNRRVSIPDELDDVVDDEEDEAWKEWGRKKLPDVKFDPPPSDFSNVDFSEFQEEMMERHTGPSFGFVKLQPGVRRSREEVLEMAMRWTKVLRTGAVEAKFMAVDVNTIMFTLERGQDTREVALRDYPHSIRGTSVASSQSARHPTRATAIRFHNKPMTLIVGDGNEMLMMRGMTAKNFDPIRYSGRWFEVGSLQCGFAGQGQEDCHCTQGEEKKCGLCRTH